MDQYDKLLVI